MAEQDVVLFAVRNAFYLGAYATCVEEAEDMEELSEAQRVERDCYVYRSHIAQGNFEVILRGARAGTSQPRACRMGRDRARGEPAGVAELAHGDLTRACALL